MKAFVHPGESLIQTVRIECKLSTGKTRIGTGFQFTFFSRKIGNKNWGIPAIVTNRHVIENSISGHFFINRMDEYGNCIYGNRIRFDFRGDDWIFHPSDENIDLAILLTHSQIKEHEKKGDKLFLVPTLHEILPTNEQWNTFSPIEDVIMVGYPNGLWDEIK